MEIKPIKKVPMTANTFTCVDCGSKYSINLASKKTTSTEMPKFCRNCKR